MWSWGAEGQWPWRWLLNWTFQNIVSGQVQTQSLKGWSSLVQLAGQPVWHGASTSFWWNVESKLFCWVETELYSQYIHKLLYIHIYNNNLIVLHQTLSALSNVNWCYERNVHTAIFIQALCMNVKKGWSKSLLLAAVVWQTKDRLFKHGIKLGRNRRNHAHDTYWFSLLSLLSTFVSQRELNYSTVAILYN